VLVVGEIAAVSESVMDDMLRAVELSAFVGVHLTVGSKLEVLWCYEVQTPTVKDRCAVEYDGDNEEYQGVITQVDGERVKVRYDEDAQEEWESVDRLLEPHNERRWLSAELCVTEDGGWMLKYEDGDKHPVEFSSADQLQHEDISQHSTPSDNSE
jgi:hypothetical protein